MSLVFPSISSRPITIGCGGLPLQTSGPSPINQGQSTFELPLNSARISSVHLDVPPVSSRLQILMSLCFLSAFLFITGCGPAEVVKKNPFATKVAKNPFAAAPETVALDKYEASQRRIQELEQENQRMQTLLDVVYEPKRQRLLDNVDFEGIYTDDRAALIALLDTYPLDPYYVDIIIEEERIIYLSLPDDVVLPDLKLVGKLTAIEELVCSVQSFAGIENSTNLYMIELRNGSPVSDIKPLLRLAPPLGKLGYVSDQAEQISKLDRERLREAGVYIF